MDDIKFKELIDRADNAIMEMDKALMDSENAFRQIKEEIYELYKLIKDGERAFNRD